MKTILASLAFVSSVLLAGCGGTEKTEPDPGPKYPTKSSFCGALPDVFCNQAVADGCTTITVDQCKAAVASKCTTLDIFFGMTEGSYNSGSAEACLAAVGGTQADAKITAEEFKAVAQSCGMMVSPNRGPGGECTRDLDCQSALSCVYSTETKTSTCQTPGTAGKGDSCSTQVCKKGLVCEPNGHLCFEGRSLGDPCTPLADPCLPTLICTNKVCAAKLSGGTACTTNDQCESGMCVSAATDKDPNARVCGNVVNYGLNTTVCNQLK